MKNHPDMTGYGFWEKGNLFHLIMAIYCIVGILT